MEEEKLDPPAETCPEGLTFYELRPYFAASHYGDQPLPLSMAMHMEGCFACRERWQFLVETDPRLSEAYWQEIEELSARLEQANQAPAVNVPNNIDELIADLAAGSSDPPVERIFWVLQAVRHIQNDEQRLAGAEHLGRTCDFILSRRNERTKAISRLQKIQSAPAGEPITIASTMDALALASCQFTAFVQEVTSMEIHGGTVYVYPDRFRRAKELFELTGSFQPFAESYGLNVSNKS